MASSGIAYQVSSFTHNVTELTEPFGCSIDEIIQFLSIVYGANVWTVVAPIQSQQMEAECVTLNLMAELTKGAKGTLSLAFKQAGGNTLTIAITNMLVGSIHRDGQSPPFQKRSHFLNEGVPVLSTTSA